MRRFKFFHGCCTTTSAMCFWAAMFAIVYGVALLAAGVWPTLATYGDTIILVALGTACVINFGRNRTLHCGLSGPLFLGAAIAAALIEARVWDVNMAVLWGLVAIGFGITLAIEWRSVGRQDAAR